MRIFVKILREKKIFCEISTMSEWLTDLEAICSSLGFWDGANYVVDSDCKEGIKDLIRLVIF